MPLIEGTVTPWYSGKRVDPVALAAGKAVAVAEIKPNESGKAIIGGNIKMRLTSTKPVKMDRWLLRVTANDPTGYESATFPGGTDDFYLWPVWFGAIKAGEVYRWYIRLESGLSGTLTTRYCKGELI